MLTNLPLDGLSWQAFERLVCRILLIGGFEDVRLVGQTNDRGADVLGAFRGKRWLIQVKHWKARVRVEVVDRTLQAMHTYRADVPVVVALNGFDDAARAHQRTLQLERIPLQLWDRSALQARVEQAPTEPPATRNGWHPRPYQTEAIRSIVKTYTEDTTRVGLIVLATGLGKTVVAAEAIRRLNEQRDIRVLALAHTNDLVYQLERSFWPFLTSRQATIVWTGSERFSADNVPAGSCVFSSVQTAYELAKADALPDFDFVLVDECHHVGAKTYDAVLGALNAGTNAGPYLLGLTATPWRPDEAELQEYFGAPLVAVDLVSGLKQGFLANVDYRMYTDNIDWDGLSELRGSRLTPNAINRSFFIKEWDDAVVNELHAVWHEQDRPRAIVFCGTVDHAVAVADRINALGFCAARAIHSNVGQFRMEPYERNLIMSDFADGAIQVICAVDIFNEGIDVPDVNIIVFQRVTHSRRIFIQQLGRGMRVTEGKDRVIVLDFVSDIRRFAAGLELKDRLAEPASSKGKSVVKLASDVQFRRVGGSDGKTESFLRQWLEDVATVQDADEDDAVLKYPPPLSP